LTTIRVERGSDATGEHLIERYTRRAEDVVVAVAPHDEHVGATERLKVRCAILLA
jgi:hypothetical protein